MVIDICDTLTVACETEGCTYAAHGVASHTLFFTRLLVGLSILCVPHNTDQTLTGLVLPLQFNTWEGIVT